MSLVPDSSPSPEESASPVPEWSSFKGLSAEDIQVHQRIARYNDLVLTDAIRPSYDLKVKPQQGYRSGHYHDSDSGEPIPVVVAAVTAPLIIDVMHHLLRQATELGIDELTVVVSSTFGSGSEPNRYFQCDRISMISVLRLIEDFQDVLLNDGYTSLNLYSAEYEWELLLDEHKLILVYGDYQDQVRAVFEDWGIQPQPEMGFISEAEHVHSRSVELIERALELQAVVGAWGSW